MTDSRVAILGGSGFVGTQLTYRLAEQVDEVLVLTRRAQRVRHLRTLVNVRVVETNIHDQAALDEALSGSSVVVNLVGILNEGGNRNEGSFAGAHTILTDKVLSACETNGVSRYLHMSALNADAENGSSEYLRTKGAAENLVKKAVPQIRWTIFQPSVIFGEQDSFFNRFAGLLRLLPVFPLAVPEARMAPVFIGDVCDVMVNAINDDSTIGQSLQLCGPQDYSLKELVEYAAQAAGLKRKVIGIPDGAARMQARVMELLPGKPFSTDNYLSLQTDSVCSDGCAKQPTSIEAVVPRYLGSSAWSGRLQKRRASARR